MSKQFKLGILGLQGRMGQTILQTLLNDPRFKFSKGLVRPGKPYEGVPVSRQQIVHHAQEVFEASDVVLDFTHADGTTDHLQGAVDTRKPFFLGTTGLTPQHQEALQKASHHIPVLQASNTSLGAAVLQRIVAQVATLLGPTYDIEIREIHHREKKDAPSGTALALGEALAQARDRSVASALNLTVHRQGPRPEGEIGFSVARGGDGKGEHEVLFLGPGETLRFSHQVSDRAIFAKGALQGIHWLCQQSPGLYKMADVLEL